MGSGNGEVGSWNAEVGMRKWEWGSRKRAEGGKVRSWEGERMRSEKVGGREWEIGPVVVPKKRDYAAAKDGEAGKKKFDIEEGRKGPAAVNVTVV